MAVSEKNLCDSIVVCYSSYLSCDFSGLSKVYSLEYLDVRENDIATLEGVRPIGRLPCLEVLILRSNPVRKIVDYRTKILELFGERCKEVGEFGQFVIQFLDKSSDFSCNYFF